MMEVGLVHSTLIEAILGHLRKLCETERAKPTSFDQTAFWFGNRDYYLKMNGKHNFSGT
jgi:hypothetical protein